MNNESFESAIKGRQYPENIEMALRDHLVGGMSKPLARRTYSIDCRVFDRVINATKDEDARLRLS